MYNYLYLRTACFPFLNVFIEVNSIRREVCQTSSNFHVFIVSSVFSVQSIKYYLGVIIFPHDGCSFCSESCLDHRFFCSHYLKQFC
jgi:hypothetical protein